MSDPIIIEARELIAPVTRLLEEAKERRNGGWPFYRDLKTTKAEVAETVLLTYVPRLLLVVAEIARRHEAEARN